VESEASVRLPLLPVPASVPLLLSGKELYDPQDTSHRRARLFCSAVLRQSAYGVYTSAHDARAGHAATGAHMCAQRASQVASSLDVALAAPPAAWESRYVAATQLAHAPNASATILGALVERFRLSRTVGAGVRKATAPTEH
jgi:hypothetical protein